MTAVTFDDGYTASILEQATVLPSLLRPLFIDEQQKEAAREDKAARKEIADRVYDLAEEMKSITDISKRLLNRAKNFHNIVVPIQQQMRLRDSLDDARSLTKKIEKKARINWGSFRANWHSKRLRKHAEKSLRNIENIQRILKPFISDEPHAETLEVLKNEVLMRQIKSALSPDSKVKKLSQEEADALTAAV